MTEAALGIDIGGTKTALGIVNGAGRVLARSASATTGHADIHGFLEELHREYSEMMKSLPNVKVTGIGVGAPNGNFYTGEIAFAPNLPWKGVIPLARLFTEQFGLPATLTNDANAAAIGEMKFGQAKGMKDFILITLGTGLGSGFVANGQMIYGHDGFAGELGHVIALRSPDARLCGCGRRGCLERYASATGIVITAHEHLAKDHTPNSLRAFGSALTALDIYEAATEGDLLALRIFDETAFILGAVLADAAAITSPEAIIFFGGLVQSGDLLLKPTQRYFEQSLLPIYRNKIKLMPSGVPGNDAAILGAAALVG
jgi:glucokinase